MILFFLSVVKFVYYDKWEWRTQWLYRIITLLIILYEFS